MSSKLNLFGIEGDKQEKYSKKVNIPQYLPKGSKPSIHKLYNIKKYEQLMQHIESSNITPEEKEFLKLAATRHIVFNYADIADYYAHSSEEMQNLMEESALVIIDFNDAIANGFVKLDKRFLEYAEQAYNTVYESESDENA